LPRIDNFTPMPNLAPKPSKPSQFDECGAAMTTALGMSGNAPTMRQPNMRRIERPSHSMKRLRGIRGAFGGSASTTSS
jgi:hypothetical protein